MKNKLFTLIFIIIETTLLSFAETQKPSTVSEEVYGDIPNYGVRYLSPDFVKSGYNGMLFVTCRTGKEMLVLKDDKVVKRIALPAYPSGIAVAPDGKHVFVSIANPRGKICKIDVHEGKVVAEAKAGHMPRSIEISNDGQTVFVANQFEAKVRSFSATDLKSKAVGKGIRDIFSLAYSAHPKRLYVLNQLPESKGGLYEENIGCSVTVLEPDTLKEITRIDLPNGSIDAKEIAVAGKYAFCTHVVARFNVPTTQVERGWINTNAVSVIDVEKNLLLATFLLDDIELGAANPYGIVANDKFLFVAQAGTHEVSAINIVGLLDRIKTKLASGDKVKIFTDICNDLSFLSGLRTRIPTDGFAPRHLALHNGALYAGMYYSDTLNKIDLKTLKAKKISLGGNEELNEIRKGDLFYHDASLCFQKWLSCVTCHTEVRSDALNWDLLNDGIGNPKQSKSMLFAHFTPPSMITGIRKNANVAVRKGIQYIQFTRRPEADAKAIDAYLSSLQPVESPYLKYGKLSENAEMGQMLFETSKCSKCHTDRYYTDGKKHDVGSGLDEYKGFAFVTPPLCEVWRTAPYLYDGRARTIFEMFRKFNKDDKHGETSKLTDEELRQLEEYVLTL